MRRLFALALLLALLAPSATSQDLPQHLVGRWWLSMAEQVGMPLNLTFAPDSAGNPRPLLYSPMQSPEPVIPSKWSFSNDTLRFSEKHTGIKMTLAFKDDIFSGSFRQGLLRMEIRFSPSDGLFVLNRPQTPVPPFPYSEREVVITRKKAGVTLTGTLSIPEGNGPFPAVILVSGSGQQNRDEELLGHKPFAVLADYLTRQGIAVLRYDDRGVGGSKGEVEKATTLDFADDAEALFSFLRKQKNIDPHKTGIIGHSEGGMIAPIVASRNKKVSFIITLGGPGGLGSDIILEQSERIMQLDSVPQLLIDRHIAALRELFSMTDTLPVELYEKTCIQLFEKHSSDLSQQEKKRAGLTRGEAMVLASQLSIPWMQTFLSLDNSKYLKKVKCPILAINGEKDCQVVPSNLDAIAKATQGRAETHLMKDLNHLMQHCSSGAPSEYMLIEQTLSPDLLSLISSWINRQ